MQPGHQRQLVTAAVLLGIFLTAIEVTAVAAAMPTAIGQLGGVGRYSWVFSAYLLTGTTTVPLYGKLADLYGRRRIYGLSVILFLIGSALSGAATSLPQLIIFRALQGLGAGGVMPVAATVIGDIYKLEERGRMQAAFSAVWAFASLVGPLLGGLITDHLSWRGVFYLSIPFGILSAWLLHRHLPEKRQRRSHELDIAGTVSLTAAVGFLLLALIEGGPSWGWGDPRTLTLLIAAVLSLIAFVRQEHRAAEPILPPDLFATRLITVSSIGNTLLGALVFGLTTYVPLYGQGVLGGTAVDAGALLTPMLVAWPISAALTGWVLLRTGYRPLLIAGGAVLVASALLLTQVEAASGRTNALIAMFLCGTAMGLMSIPYIIGVQNAVPWARRGVATSSVMFFRNIGGAVAVAALGALFHHRLDPAITAGLDPNTALEPDLRSALEPGALATLERVLQQALTAVYYALALLAIAKLITTFFFPGGSATSHAHQEGGQE